MGSRVRRQAHWDRGAPKQQAFSVSRRLPHMAVNTAHTTLAIGKHDTRPGTKGVLAHDSRPPPQTSPLALVVRPATTQPESTRLAISAARRELARAHHGPAAEPAQARMNGPTEKTASQNPMRACSRHRIVAISCVRRGWGRRRLMSCHGPLGSAAPDPNGPRNTSVV